MMKIAMLGGWHVHAKGYAREFNALPNACVTAVWDDDTERGAAWARELDVPFYTDLDDLLAHAEADAVCVGTATNLHPEVLIKAANAGKHIFTEKVMALTNEDAEAIAAAVRKAGVKFCISFPHRCMPHNLFAKQLLDEGLLGEITLLRIRNAHAGASNHWLPPHFYNAEQCGGGAMMDLGAHGMYLANWLLGEPVRISSMFNARESAAINNGVEDNAVCVMEFANKALAITETGFVSDNSPFSLELYGTAGSLFVGGPENKVQFTSSKFNSAAPVPGWLRPQLPKALPEPTRMFANGVTEGTEILFGLDEALTLTRMMVAAYAADREQKVVRF